MNTIANSAAKASQADPISRSKAVSLELKRVARRARIPRPVNSGGGGFRARRSDRLYRGFFIGSFLAFFVLPTLLAAFYYIAVAQDQYITEARFAVRSGDGNGLEELASFASLLNVGQSSDGQIIAEYVKSRSIVEELEKQLDLRKIFQPGTWDLVAEAPREQTMESFVKYWGRQVGLKVDRGSGLVTLSVRTFSPDDSLKLAQEILKISERMVNQLTRGSQENALKEASAELSLTKHRLEAAVTAMRDARIKLGVLDVDLAADTYSDVITKLYTELSKVETQINTLKENKVRAAPQLVTFEARAKSIRDQVAQYEARMAGDVAGGKDTENLAIGASELADKQIELSIAQNEYKLAVASYESARLNNERQRSYLLTYVVPSLPQEALYPKRLLTWCAIAGASFLAWALLAGLAILVRDNTAA